MKIETECALCGGRPPSTVVYPERLDSEAFSTEVFSARRIPDRRHYTWVRCSNCGLMRSDPISDADLGTLYLESTFDYGSEVKGLTQTYLDVIKAAVAPKRPAGKLVEIGCGNGFVLDAALDIGFDDVVGIEPSVDAVSQAPERIKSRMITDMMRPGLVEENSADVVAIFHTLDHLTDPVEILRLCFQALRPGGTFVAAVHDVESYSAKILRERSPIFDVEHTYLYSKQTGPKLLEKVGFVDAKATSYANHSSLSYLVHLFPIPAGLKRSYGQSRLQRLGEAVPVHLPFGNLSLVGTKPLD